MRVLLFILASVISGCASHPFAQKWDWNTRHHTNFQEQTRLEQNEKMAKIRAEHPDWDNHISDDEVVVNCISDKNQTVCLGK